MRKKIKLIHEKNMFGTTVSMTGDSTNHVLAENLEVSWKKLNKRVKGGYFFRAPSITLSGLSTTARFLSQMQNPFQFEVYEMDGKWDSVLRISDQGDAEYLAWSLNGLYDKWSDDQEKEYKAQLKQKPLKAVVGKDGKVRIRGKMTVIDLPPDPS